MRAARNCRNKLGYKETILHVGEWRKQRRKPVYKKHDYQYRACPVSSITNLTIKLIGILTDCCDNKGRMIVPYAAGGYQDQPPWFIQAVHIYREEMHKYRQYLKENPPEKQQL